MICLGDVPRVPILYSFFAGRIEIVDNQKAILGYEHFALKGMNGVLQRSWKISMIKVASEVA